MTDFTILQTTHVGDDLLLVRGTHPDVVGSDGEPAILEASGWVSAITNHYDDNSLDANGQRKPGTKARVMTASEAQAYVQRLLWEHNGHLIPPDRQPDARPLDLATLGVR